MSAPLLVRAARREPVERTPVWFMRQAGRSLPEYRALRERYGLFEIARNPELCAEVTLQPVLRHGVDAAVTDASQLSVPDEIAPEVCDAIRIVRAELDEEQAVIGFCGGPFTVAGYLVEGKPTREFAKVKTMMYAEPERW